MLSLDFRKVLSLFWCRCALFVGDLNFGHHSSELWCEVWWGNSRHSRCYFQFDNSIVAAADQPIISRSCVKIASKACWVFVGTNLSLIQTFAKKKNWPCISYIRITHTRVILVFRLSKSWKHQTTGKRRTNPFQKRTGLVHFFNEHGSCFKVSAKSGHDGHIHYRERHKDSCRNRSWCDVVQNKWKLQITSQHKTHVITYACRCFLSGSLLPTGTSI